MVTQGTPSPEGNLLPKLDAQAEVENSVEASELPFQERRELFEFNVQPQQQQQQPTQQQLQFDQDTAIRILASIKMGKRPTHPTNNDHEHEHDTTKTIQFLLDKVSHLQKTIEQLSTTNTGGAQSTPMQVQIFIPVASNSAHLDAVSELQGPKDPFRIALGHFDLQAEIHNLAPEVINTGKSQKSQMVAGTITDVTNVVQAEVARITKENEQHIAITIISNGYKDVLDVVRRQTDTGRLNTATQASPIGVSSGGSNGVGNESTNNEIIAQLGLGHNGDRDGDRGGNGAGGSVDHDSDNNKNFRYGGGKKA